jgi:hypothetical protein
MGTNRHLALLHPTSTHRAMARARPAEHGRSLYSIAPLSASRRPPTPDSVNLLFQQRSIGNAGVGRLVGEHPRSPTAVGSPIRRFGAAEHREIGELATNRKYVKLGTKGYTIGYGEMIALAGDIFPNLEYMVNLANNPGKGPDSQEALDYARFILIKPDDVDGGLPQEAHKYKKSSYTEKTSKAVDDMYYNLAADNAEHFVTPRGKDAMKAPQDRPRSAGQSYRSYHEEALSRAAVAGKAGLADDEALAAEGFGAHYLTDAVSAGHIRTPRLDIVERWDKDNPELVERFKDYLAFRVVEWIVNNKWYGKTVRPRYSFDKAMDSVSAAIDARPPLTMGVLVAVAVHDYDNQHGLKVLSEGKEKTVFGDSHLHEGDTEAIAVAAVKAGVDDVKQAYQLGKEGKTFDEIKAILLAGGTQYKGETILPHLRVLGMREENPMPKWAVGSFADLLADAPMKEALRTAVLGNVSEIKKVAASQPEPGKTAILKGFADRVSANPIDELIAIYYNDGSQTEQFLSKFDSPM